MGKKKAKEKKKLQVDSNPCSTGPEASTLPADPLDVLRSDYWPPLRDRLSKIHDNRQQQKAFVP